MKKKALRYRKPALSEQPVNITGQEGHTVRIGPFAFLTALSGRSESGDRASQTARRHRKVTALPLRHGEDRHPADVVADVAHRWSSLVYAEHMSWWIAIAFMLGASGFMLGCIAVLWPMILPEPLTRPRGITWTFVVGAIFFTLAALLQWIQSMKNGLEEGFSATVSFRLLRTHDLGYWACLIQFAGTLFFNLNTADALLIGLSPTEQEVVIYTPNLLGSICFLLASQLAIMEYAHGCYRWTPGEISWWIVYLNMLGSLLFALSLAGSFLLTDGSALAPRIAILSTFAGAMCFFIAAYLLIPESQEKAGDSNK